MSYTLGWMDHAEQQLTQWVAADTQARQRSEVRSAVVYGGVGLAVLVMVLVGSLVAARPLVRPLRQLDAATPQDAGAGTPPRVSDISAGFLWRNHSLAERLLRLIDSLELTEDDPDRLASLFEMDHLVTRIWRHSDGALALAGHDTPRPAGPLALVDVLRAAASEIEEYGRVVLDAQRDIAVSGTAATDTVHLLAELLENATAFSPDTSQVIVSGHAVRGGGALITVTDGGPGLPDAELARLNWQLAEPAVPDMAAAPQMGLFTVALLAGRHGITVTLGTPPGGGTTAEVHIPAALVCLDPESGGWQAQPGQALPVRASEEAGTPLADLPFSAVRFVAGPLPPLGPETDEPEAVPLVLDQETDSAATPSARQSRARSRGVSGSA